MLTSQERHETVSRALADTARELATLPSPADVAAVKEAAAVKARAQANLETTELRGQDLRERLVALRAGSREAIGAGKIDQVRKLRHDARELREELAMLQLELPIHREALAAASHDEALATADASEAVLGHYLELRAAVHDELDRAERARLAAMTRVARVDQVVSQFRQRIALARENQKRRNNHAAAQ